MDDILMLAGSATTFVKVAIDLLRMAVDLPRWAPPALAALFGVGFVAIFMVAARLPFTPDGLAQGFLAGLVAGGLAVGATEIGARAEQAARIKRQPS